MRVFLFIFFAFSLSTTNRPSGCDTRRKRPTRFYHGLFRSPRRLNLQLCCSPKTPARDTLDVWPALPLNVLGYMGGRFCYEEPVFLPRLPLGTDGIIAALAQSNRVCSVHLWGLTGWQLEEILAPMQVPFRWITVMQLYSYDETLPVIPDSFLGGSAPHLQYFKLSGIPFPGAPKLLLAATRLVNLRLWDIPHSGYISPEEMVALFSVLSSLESLSLGFQSPQSRPDREIGCPPPPSTRSIMPVLDFFCLQRGYRIFRGPRDPHRCP